jgi:hypothetical protein
MPYPALLQEQLGLTALNFGFAGAGPRFFLKNERRLRYINEGRFAVVQVMSGRSEDNSAFSTGGNAIITSRSDGQPVRDSRQPYIRAEEAWGELLANDELDAVRALVEETRANWVRTFSSLLEAIEVPKILFWFSKRPPDYEESYSDVYSLFGEFPQLVNRAMVAQITPLADEYVECLSKRGTPQPLFSRFTGEPVTVTDQAWSSDRGALSTITQAVNSYYPSPEMHADAADALTVACRTWAAL